MTFWILVAAVTLLIGTIAFYPLWKKSNAFSAQKRNDLNKAFYFDRLQEVEREANEGVIDDLDQTKRELQQSLLDDIPTEAEPESVAKKSHGKLWFAGLLLLVGGISSGIYLNVGSWFAGTMLEKSHEKLPYFYERLKSENSSPLSEQELNQFSVALRLEAQKKPSDHQTWFMLGQVGMASDNLQLALDAFAKAYQLEPQNPQYQRSYAQILLSSADPQDKAQGEMLLKGLIRENHSDLDSLNMLAFRAFEQEDYKTAAATWDMMLKLMSADDPRRTTIERSKEVALSMVKE